MNYNPSVNSIGPAERVLGDAPVLNGAYMLDQSGRLNVNARRIYLDPRDGNAYTISRNAAGKSHALQVNAPALLRYDEWKDIDRAVIEASVQRMIGIADLRSSGLTHNLGSIGATISLWETASDMTEANISMSATTRGEKDTQAYDTDQVPVPIVHKDFSVELRRLVASRAQGGSIDVTQASIAGRVVAERSEKMLFQGAGVVVNGSTIYGYITHPDRNTVDLSDLWDDSATTGADILDDVQQMLAAARADRHYGPYRLYIPGNYETKLDEDYRDNDQRTVRERLLQLNGLQSIAVADFLPDDNVILVQMTRDVVDLAIAQDITTVQWSVNGGMEEDFKVMAVWVPRIKSDFDNRSGIVHLRPAG